MVTSKKVTELAFLPARLPQRMETDVDTNVPFCDRILVFYDKRRSERMGKQLGVELVVAALVSACVPPPPAQLAPKTTRTNRPVQEIAQIASQTLAASGFEIVTSDAAGGVVTARRHRATTGNSEFVSCRYKRNSIAESSMETTLTVTVAAKANAGNSDAIVSSSVRAEFPSLTGALKMAPSDTDCASTGSVEARILDAIRGS